MNKSCSTCENSIFDEQYGEYKCKLYQIRVKENNNMECYLDPNRRRRQNDLSGGRKVL